MLNVLAAQLGEGTPVSTNSYESIATVTVGSGGSSSISFTSIPSTYKHLQIRGISRSSASGTYYNAKLQVGNGSVDTGSNYSWHYLVGDGSSASASGASSQTGALIYQTSGASGAGANIFNGFVLDILDYANTSKNKTFRTLGGIDANGSGTLFLWSGAWLSTSAINTLSITIDTGIAQYSSFALYGIKG